MLYLYTQTHKTLTAMIRRLIHRWKAFVRYCNIEQIREKRIALEINKLFREQYGAEMDKETDRQVDEFCRCSGTYFDYMAATAKKSYWD